MQGWKEQRLCLMQRLKRWCFPLSLEISGRGCPRILSRHHLFNGVANFDAFEESACKSGEALSSFAEGRICPRSQFPSSRSFARNRENYLSRTCRIKLYSISFFARPRKNNTFSKLLRSTVLPAEKFLTRHNVVKTCWKLFVPLRRVCSIKTERSLVRSTSENPIDDDSRQEKFRSSSLFELLVGRDDSLLSFGRKGSRWSEETAVRLIGRTPSGISFPPENYHPLWAGEGGSFATGMSETPLIARVWWRETSRDVSRFLPVSIATSMPSKTFNHGGDVTRWGGDGEKLVSDVNTGIDSFSPIREDQMLGRK